MSESQLVMSLVERVKALRVEAMPLEGLAAARQLSLRLDHALDKLEAAGPLARPLHVALLGGTGVGKSSLFNALLSRPNASPTSDAERCYTKVPYVASTRADRPLVAVPASLQPVFVEGGSPGVVLCDTPDVDGMLEQNRAVTRELIERGDLVVCVTSPDKRANFDILQEVRDWAAKKRWFFVMNKMDWHEEQQEAIRADFDRRLRELGFHPDDHSRFLVSAEKPDRFDFPRLKTALLQPRPEEQLALLRLDAFLGYVQHAVEEPGLALIEKAAKDLAEEESKLHRKIHIAYCAGLRAPEAGEAFRLVVREATWRHLGPRSGWFMGFPIWLRCRFSLVWTSYQVSRITMGGLGIFGILGAAATAVVAAIRGLMPLKQVLTALGPPFRRCLDEVRADARRALEDKRLTPLALEDASGESTAGINPAAMKSLESTVPLVGKQLDQLVKKLALPDGEEEALAQLGADVERVGQLTARKATGGFFGWLKVLIANLPPAAMLGWIVYRIGEAWFHRDYLPWSYYGMAIALLLVSLLPGFILLAWSVRSRVAAIDPPALVEQVDQREATVVLRRAHQALARFTSNAGRLRVLVRDTREMLEEEGRLTSQGYGTAQRNNTLVANDKKTAV